MSTLSLHDALPISTRVKTAFAPKVRGPLPPLVMCTAPQFTVIVADELLLPVFASAVAETVAVFGMLGQSPAVVARLRVTVRVEPFVIAPKLQDRTPAVIEQDPAFVPLRAQVPAGRVSETVTLAESPVPPAVTRSVKLAVSPAFSGPLPDLRIRTSGQLTVVETMFESIGPGVRVPWLLTEPHAAAVAVTLMVIVTVVPAFTVPRLHVTTCEETEQVPSVDDGVPLIVRPVGTVSLTETPACAPVPVFETVSVYVNGTPSVAVAGPLLLIDSAGVAMT